MHYFPGLSEETILWGMSYTNLNMYLATIPVFDTDEDESPAPVAAAAPNNLSAEEKEMNRLFKSFVKTV